MPKKCDVIYLVECFFFLHSNTSQTNPFHWNVTFCLSFQQSNDNVCRTLLESFNLKEEHFNSKRDTREPNCLQLTFFLAFSDYFLNFQFFLKNSLKIPDK